MIRMQGTRNGERGASSVEYAILVGLIAAVLIPVVANLGPGVQHRLDQAAQAITTRIGDPSNPEDQPGSCDADGHYTGSVLWVRLDTYSDGSQSLTNTAGTALISDGGDPARTLVEEQAEWVGLPRAIADEQSSGWSAEQLAPYLAGFTNRPDDGHAWHIEGSSCTHDSGRQVTDSCDANGNYTGDYSNWYWLRQDYYANGTYTYTGDGVQWDPNPNWDVPAYTYDERGQLLGSGHSNEVRYMAGGQLTPVPGTWYTYQNGYLAVPDPGSGYDEPYWDGNQPLRTEAERGAFQQTIWLGYLSDWAGGILMATPPTEGELSPEDACP